MTTTISGLVRDADQLDKPDLLSITLLLQATYTAAIVDIAEPLNCIANQHHTGNNDDGFIFSNGSKGN